jgi:hypothetical protein
MAEIITSVYDPPHLFDLRAGTDGALARRGNDGDTAKQFQANFIEHLYSTQEDASRALLARADELGLFGVQENYFHHALAVGDDALYDIMAHASLQDIGRLSLAVGAGRGCVVVDNGGSPNLPTWLLPKGCTTLSGTTTGASRPLPVSRSRCARGQSKIVHSLI